MIAAHPETEGTKEMIDAITKPELITGVLVVIGAGGIAARKLGWLSIGRQSEPGVCPDPACHEALEIRLAQIVEARDDITEIKRSLAKDVFPAINRTSEAVSRIEGRLDEIAKRR